MQSTVRVENHDVVLSLTVWPDAGSKEKLSIHAEGESARIGNHPGGQYGLRGTV